MQSTNQEIRSQFCNRPTAVLRDIREAAERGRRAVAGYSSLSESPSLVSSSLRLPLPLSLLGCSTLPLLLNLLLAHAFSTPHVLPLTQSHTGRHLCQPLCPTRFPYSYKFFYVSACYFIAQHPRHACIHFKCRGLDRILKRHKLVNEEKNEEVSEVRGKIEICLCALLQGGVGKRHCFGLWRATKIKTSQVIFFIKVIFWLQIRLPVCASSIACKGSVW